MKNHKLYYQTFVILLIKRIFVLSFLIFVGIFSHAKEFKTSPYNKRILSFNPGVSFSGSGDGFGIGSELSHLKTLTPWLFHKETISSWIVNGESWIESGIDNQTGMDFSFELGIAPFLSPSRSLSFSGGVCIGSIMSIYPSGGGSMSRNNGEAYYQYFDNRYEKQVDYGFTVAANYHYFINSKLSLNLRAAFRAYSNTGNAISIMSAGIGYRIN